MALIWFAGASRSSELFQQRHKTKRAAGAALFRFYRKPYWLLNKFCGTLAAWKI